MLKNQDMLLYGGMGKLLKDYILLLWPKTFSDYSPWMSSLGLKHYTPSEVEQSSFAGEKSEKSVGASP